jgi:hypothetical protein
LAAAILRTQYDNLIRQTVFSTGIYHAYLIFRLSKQNALPPVDLSFIHLLRLTKAFGSEVSHDIIYALLGVTTKDNNDELGQRFVDVDYSISQDELLRQVAEKLLLQQRLPLSFLCNAGLEKAPEKALVRSAEPIKYERDPRSVRRRPEVDRATTWIPNWTPDGIGMLSPWSLSNSFTPAKNLPFRRWDTQDPNILAVGGIQISTVLWTSQQFWDGWKENLEALCKLVQHPAFQPVTRETLQQFCRALTAGRDAYGAPEEDSSALTRDFAAFLATCKSVELDAVISEAGVDGTSRNFLDVADVLCNGRKVFLTASGHLGYGAWNTEAGDIVVVLGGANMPFLLRRKSNSLFELVGECYVDDIMAGEAVEAIEALHRPCDEVELRGESSDYDMMQSVNSGEALHGCFPVVEIVDKLFRFHALDEVRQSWADEALWRVIALLEREEGRLEARRFDIR